MKGFKVVASGIILLGLMVCAPKANAENLPNTELKPQIEKLPVESTPNFTQSPNNNSNAKAYLDQGFELLDKEDYRGAIKAFSQLISLSPDNPYGYFGRGLAYFSTKEYQAAKADFDASINLDSSIAYNYLFRGMSNYALGSKDLAIADLQVAANLFEKEGKTDLAQQSLDAIKRIRNA
ncbi:TPR repeat-containing protein [Calothrix sp. NIES-2100]|uniref:tetratricopeptide repeat protein n=1 Tax=Calothrix sp. NIES-2100 TaxID=1954172 RepID=UPI000B622DCB|nr:TPR repeat-containing protein [Calothrix sp. NIES-2100]